MIPRLSRRLFRPLAFTAIAVVLSSCSGSFLPGANNDPPKLYTLTPKNTFTADLPKVDWQMTVAVPNADAALNTARIALRRSAVSLEYYARANWIDTTPQMVQRLLVESFENSGRIISIGRQSVTLRADYSLLTDLRDFQAEYLESGNPRVRVRLNAKLIKMPQREIVALENFEFVQQAASEDLPAIVDAFDIALGKTLKRIVAWTLNGAPPVVRRGSR